ncbi:MAG: 4Fe-4S dicluster domain-containing protein [Acidobacteria bacterium]|nr:4Fe-4S dicluster domain-containing protein [Acidobacteriota bacterium]
MERSAESLALRDTPRSAESLALRDHIDKCVHCGFCLPSCPTYMLWGEEMDSPRGRIYLMKAGLDGRAAMTDGFVRHFDACLGCMACVTACPSGVQYAPLIEATRGQIERQHSRSLGDRLFRRAIFAVLPYPARLRIALLPLAALGSLRHVGRVLRTRQFAGSKRTRPTSAATAGSERTRPTSDDQRPTTITRLRAALALAPRVTWASLFASLPERTPAVGERRLTVGLLTGCAQRVMFPQVNRATVNVLSAEGCDVVAPSAQACCGALALHAGRLDEARACARRTIEAFEQAYVDRIAVNAAGCGSSMKEYGELLADDPAWAARASAFASRVRDVSELVDELGRPRATRHPLKLRIAYQDACHLAHAQGIRQPPRNLLASIPGVELLAMAEADVCCGSAGIYNLVEPDTARQLGDRKAAHITAVNPDVVASANPGCTLQIGAAAKRRGHEWRVLHPIEILDASIKGKDILSPQDDEGRSRTRGGQQPSNR